MREIKVTEKRYVCDNCGGKHKCQTKIFEDYFSGKEICSSCAKKIEIDYLDVNIYEMEKETVCDISEDNIRLFEYIQNQLADRLIDKVQELKKHLANNSLDVFIKENNIDTKEFFYY